MVGVALVKGLVHDQGINGLFVHPKHHNGSGEKHANLVFEALTLHGKRHSEPSVKPEGFWYAARSPAIRGFESYKDAQTPRDHRVLQDKSNHVVPQ